MYVLIQEEFGNLDLGTFCEICAQTYGISRIDGMTKAKQARPGVPGFGLSEEQAGTMQQLLEDQGVATFALPLGDVSALPNAKTFRRAGFTDAGIELIDMYERMSLVPWSACGLLAAGLVGREVTESYEVNPTTEKGEYARGAKMAAQTALNVVSTFSVLAGGTGIFVTGAAAKQPNEIVEETSISYVPVCEVFTDGEHGRIRFEANRFDFSILGERQTNDPAENFQILLAMILECSDEAVSCGPDIIDLVSGEGGINAFEDKDGWDAYCFWQLQLS